MKLNYSKKKEDFEAIFREHYSIVYKVAVHITRDTEASKDLAQDLFFKLWNEIHKIEDIKNLKAYLLKSIKNRAFDYLKNQNRINSLMDPIELQYELEDLDDSKITDANIIAKAISILPEKCRLVFSLSKMEGLTNREISEYLNISEKTVENQITKAFKLLRSELKVK